MSLKQCQFCRKHFATQHAVNQHISASRVCLKEWHNDIVSKDENPLKRKRTNSPEPCLVAEDNYIPPPEPHQGSPSWRATVEDADNEDGACDHKRYIEPFLGPAGEALRREKTSFEILQQEHQSEGKVSWEPFANKAEWELVVWLIKNFGQKSTDEYLQLPIVS